MIRGAEWDWPPHGRRRHGPIVVEHNEIRISRKRNLEQEFWSSPTTTRVVGTLWRGTILALKLVAAIILTAIVFASTWLAVTLAQQWS